MESTDTRKNQQQLIKRKDSEMKYETEIFFCFGCNVVLQTDLDLTDKIKYYIGVGKGKNQQFDEDLIVAGGAPFYPDSIKELEK